MVSIRCPIVVVANAFALLLSVGLVQAQSGVVEITTLPPIGPYQALGIVSEIAQKHSAMFDASKAVRDAIQALFPGLEAQAKARGANLVVLTQVIPVADSGGVYFIGIGTAVRTAAVSATGPSGQTSPPASQASAQPKDSRDLSGRWVGKLLEHGEKVPIDVVLNLMSAGAQGTYTGGLTLSDPKCEISLATATLDGQSITFKQESASLFRCKLFSTHVGTLTEDGKLDWKVYRSGKSPHFDGTLERQ